MTLQRSSLAVFVLVIASCGSGERRPAVIVSDSAGIQIVESTAPRWGPDDTWHVEGEPALQIGRVEGELPYLFSNIEGALLLADGRIAVADRGSAQIRFFLRDGTYDGHVGRSGEGPGEFGYIRGLGRCGADSLFVFEIDFETKVFSPDGAFVRQARPYDHTTPDRNPYALECSRNGYYVAVGWRPLGRPMMRAPIGFYRADAPVWILAPSHLATNGSAHIEQAGLVITAELGTFLSSERIGSQNGSRPHPFGRALRLTVAPDAVYLGTGEDYEIRAYSLDGTLARIIRWSGRDLTISDEDMQAYRASQLESVAPDARPALEQELSEMPIPPAFPAYVRLETDPRGNIWIEEFRRPRDDSRHWTVLTAEGEFLGRVEVPLDLNVMDIGESEILGVSRDEFGVERIRIHRLVKTDAARRRSLTSQ